MAAGALAGLGIVDSLPVLVEDHAGGQVLQSHMPRDPPVGCDHAGGQVLQSHMPRDPPAGCDSPGRCCGGRGQSVPGIRGL
jgi:hypothetical protein